MIKLPLNKKTFAKFLAPISRLGDKSVIKFYKNKIYTLMSSEDNTIILYATSISTEEVSDLIKINISDVKKLLRAVDCF